jgi:hypothetical protein
MNNKRQKCDIKIVIGLCKNFRTEIDNFPPNSYFHFFTVNESKLSAVISAPSLSCYTVRLVTVYRCPCCCVLCWPPWCSHCLCWCCRLCSCKLVGIHALLASCCFWCLRCWWPHRDCLRRLCCCLRVSCCCWPHRCYHCRLCLLLLAFSVPGILYLLSPSLPPPGRSEFTLYH